MKSQHRSSGRPISGKTPQEIASNTTSEIKRIWDRINEIAKKLNESSTGNTGVSDSVTEIRLVQVKEAGDNAYYIEAKYPDGWCRLSTKLERITKGGS